MTANLISVLREQLAQLKPSAVRVGLSGGIDSLVLLDLFNQLHLPEIELTAVHIHHGLNPMADDWVLHCEKFCQQRNIPLQVIKVKVEQAAELGIEAAARNARYQALASTLSPNELLATAHHLNDQAETLLLQLMRGSGPKGLAAMPRLKPLGKGQLWRPLLNCSRAEIEAYAKQQNLTWVDDSSNQSIKFDRNYLRHTIMPKLQLRWPASSKLMLRSAQHCAEACELLDELAKIDLNSVRGSQPNELKIKFLQSLSESRQRNLIRYWLHQLGLPIPEAKQLHELQLHLLTAKIDAQPKVSWCNIECRRYDQTLYVMTKLEPFNSALVFNWPQDESMIAQCLGATVLEQIKATLEQLSLSFEAEIQIRFRQGGEHCQLPKRSGTHSLKKLMQEWRVPPWQRNQIPLIYSKQNLVAVVGYSICQS